MQKIKTVWHLKDTTENKLKGNQKFLNLNANCESLLGEPGKSLAVSVP